MKTKPAVKIMSVAIAPPAYEYVERLAVESGLSVSRFVVSVLGHHDPKIAELDKIWRIEQLTGKLDGTLHVKSRVEVDEIEGDDK
jgi:hypothetical protein